MEWRIGQLVFSIAGRDKGRPYLVCRLEEDMVWVTDGDLHPEEKPKKKKQKHLNPSWRAEEALAVRWSENRKVYDHEIRKAIEELTKP